MSMTKRFYVYKVVDETTLYWDGQDWSDTFAQYYTESEVYIVAARVGGQVSEASIY